MKKLILAILAVGSVAAANAQKNSILVYGTAGVNTDNSDRPGQTNTYTDWHIMPGVGYQFTKSMTVGLQGGFWSQHDESRTGAGTTSVSTINENREWQLGAFFRYTHYINNIFAVYGQANFNYISGQGSTRTAGITTFNDGYGGFTGYVQPAVQAHVGKGFALNFGFGHLGFRTTTMDKTAGGDNNFNFAWGNQFNWGVSKNIGCGRKMKNRHKPGDDMRSHDHGDDEDDMPRRKKSSDDDE